MREEEVREEKWQAADLGTANLMVLSLEGWFSPAVSQSDLVRIRAWVCFRAVPVCSAVLPPHTGLTLQTLLQSLPCLVPVSVKVTSALWLLLLSLNT